MGILPLFFSYPQALVCGANPVTLTSGGTAIWVLVVASTFWLAWRVYGPVAAGWAVIPLACSSLGTIWLSGRISGGHLLTLVWHTTALAGLHACLTRGGCRSAIALGLWCGLGLYLDAMFLFTLAGLLPAALLWWLQSGRPKTGLAGTAVFLAGLSVGLAPAMIGRWVDPYDAYPSQFSATWDWPAIRDHARLLGFVCLPRLISGIELPELLAGSRTAGDGLADPPAWIPPRRNRHTDLSLVARAACAALALALFAAAVPYVVPGRSSTGDRAGHAVRWGVLLSAMLILGAFLVNQNIYNSDNYRYLVYAIPPWCLGFGSMLSDLSASRRGGGPAAGAIALCFAVVMTATLLDWYRDVRHYVDRGWSPVRVTVRPWEDVIVHDPHPRNGEGRAFRWRVEPDVTHVFGPYWDVYRLAFRSGGRVVGIPLPLYPNRFRGWSRGIGPSEGTLLVLEPREFNWRDALVTVWKNDGRDPAELSRIRIIIPTRETARR
jgi:hypothetical protein